MLVEISNMFSGKYIVVMAQQADDQDEWSPYWTSPLTTTAEKKQYCTYNYASLLLAVSTKNTYLLNLGWWGATNMQNLWKTDVGSPLGNYSIIPGKHVYVRDFSKAKVLVNPSTSSYQIDLVGSYKKLDGTPVSSPITMNAHTGEILLKTTV
jgi:hypothetical protein